jgi:ribosomal protein L17
MDKSSSVIAALDAGKLPSTQQFGHFLDWLNNVGITNIEPLAMAQLSSQGRILANDLRRLLEAYKQFLDGKNGTFHIIFHFFYSLISLLSDDNILQEAIWHLERGDLVATSEAREDQEQALKDIHALQRSLRVIMKVAYRNVTTEGTHLFGDFASIMRVMLADAAELVETHAGKAKETLRHVERDVKEGKRDSLGRNKEALEARREDPKLKWEHGVDTVKDTGSMVIGASRAVAGAVEDTTERTTSRIQNAFYSVSCY